ncbi:hypothetical protein [Bifidobacterium sp.]|uniref:hypothetical protein n=1 Tax=Bifidobacterium sp. TaxID=41200 RepID=UPI0025B81319|nr:hypothetical protein [Bifidobacterium sp.]MCH4209459.1 hypothetical protein [Bifidobacterium sp.]
MTFKPGRLISLTGPPGLDKSTLLNCIGLLEHANAGMIIDSLHDIAGHSGVVIIATRSDHVAKACDGTIELE